WLTTRVPPSPGTSPPGPARNEFPLLEIRVHPCRPTTSVSRDAVRSARGPAALTRNSEEPLPMPPKADDHPRRPRAARQRQKTVVVIGNGMVGHRFCERLVEFDADRKFRVVTFCEEPRPAYDRVNLTKYFEHRKAEKLALSDPQWYEEKGVTLFVGDR